MEAAGKGKKRTTKEQKLCDEQRQTIDRNKYHIDQLEVSDL
jgi:hypothetical protein